MESPPSSPPPARRRHRSSSPTRHSDRHDDATSDPEDDCLNEYLGARLAAAAAGGAGGGLGLGLGGKRWTSSLGDQPREEQDDAKAATATHLESSEWTTDSFIAVAAPFARAAGLTSLSFTTAAHVPASTTASPVALPPPPPTPPVPTEYAYPPPPPPPEFHPQYPVYFGPPPPAPPPHFPFPVPHDNYTFPPPPAYDFPPPPPFPGPPFPPSPPFSYPGGPPFLPLPLLHHSFSLPDFSLSHPPPLPFHPQPPPFPPFPSLLPPPPNSKTCVATLNSGDRCDKPAWGAVQTCGCPICRDHGGQVLRSYKTIDYREGTTKKVFECSACGSHSQQFSPIETGSTPPAMTTNKEERTKEGKGWMNYRSGPNQPEQSRDPIKLRTTPRKTTSLQSLGRIHENDDAEGGGEEMGQFGFTLYRHAPPHHRVPHRLRSASAPLSSRPPAFAPRSPVQFRQQLPPRSPVLLRNASFTVGGGAVEEEERETYKLEDNPWPILKVENIPFGTTVKDLEEWLPKSCYPPSTSVCHPIHLILHREVGRTLPHCYVEISDAETALEILTTKDRTLLGDRTVRIKFERRGELMRDLFTQEEYFFVPTRNPAAAPLPPAPIQYQFPIPILQSIDFAWLALPVQVPRRDRPIERAFLNVVSLVAKFPWYKDDLWSCGLRDELFDCVHTVTTLAIQCSAEEPEFRTIVDKLVRTTDACPGFTSAQKARIRDLDEARIRQLEWTQFPHLPYRNPQNPLTSLVLPHSPPLSPPLVRDAQKLRRVPSTPLSLTARPSVGDLSVMHRLKFKGADLDLSALASSSAAAGAASTLTTPISNPQARSVTTPLETPPVTPPAHKSTSIQSSPSNASSTPTQQKRA
ncbi:hypothetical protein RQP46_005347 [Phenoliferia psychrophenolica]